MYVLKPEQIPTGPHWTIVTFKQVTRTEPGYDKGDPPESYSVTETSLEVFTVEEEWRHAIATHLLANSRYASKEQFVCYHVDKVATATLKPVVEIT